MNQFLLDAKAKSLGYTNEQMARLLSIDPATYYKKKTGRSEFTRKELQKIRSVLKMSQEEFENIFFED